MGRGGLGVGDTPDIGISECLNEVSNHHMLIIYLRCFSSINIQQENIVSKILGVKWCGHRFVDDICKFIYADAIIDNEFEMYKNMFPYMQLMLNVFDHQAITSTYDSMTYWHIYK